MHKKMFFKRIKNYKVQFLDNPMINDKFELKKGPNSDLSQPELAC